MAENIPVIENNSRVAKTPEELAKNVENVENVETPEVSPTENPIVEPTPVVEPEKVTLESWKESFLNDEAAKLRENALRNAQVPSAPVTPVKEEAPVVPQVSEKEQLEVDEKKQQNQIAIEQKKLEKFRELMESNASKEKLASYVNENPELRNEFQIGFKNFYKNKQNFEYQQKYATASPEKLYDAYVNSDIVVWDSKYNALPPETKQAFEQYKTQREILASKEEFETSLNNDELKIYGETAEEAPTFVALDLREEYKKLTEAPEYIAKRTEVSELSTELGLIKQKLEDIEDDVLAEFEWSGRSEAAIYATIRKRQKEVSKEYRQVSVEYQNALAAFSDMKSTIAEEKELLIYENQQAFQQYQTELAQYNTDRQRMDNFAIMEFERQNQILAEERQLENNKKLAEFNKKLQEESLSGGDLVDDKKGNLVYVKDGQIISVLEWLWTTQSISYDDEFIYDTKYDDKNGVWTTLIRNKKTWEISVDTRGINGEQDYISTLWNGKITSYGGSHDGWTGLDIDVEVWDPVYAPFSWEIVEAMSHPMYGITIKVKDDATGEMIRYSHLDPSLLYNGGTRFEKGAIIAKAWNTWNVLKMDGTKPSKEELAQWFGSHLDIVSYDSNGNPRSSRETEEYLRNIGKQTTESVKDLWSFTYAEVSSYNNPTFKPQDLEGAELEKYNTFLNEKLAIMNDKNANIEDVISYSLWGDKLAQSETETLWKFETVFWQISDINAEIQNLETWPIIGKLAEMNPYNTSAQTLKAQMTALIPNLARWVYGEVGVLTDNDIRNYAQTIPKLTSTEDVNKAILAMNLKMLAGGYKRQLQNLANSWNNVAFYRWSYDNIMSQVWELESELWIGNSATYQVNWKEVNFNKYTWWVAQEQSNLENIFTNY